MDERFTAAAVQPRCTEDVARNLANAFQGVRRAAKAGARLVVLPERFPYYGMRADLARASADTVPGHLCNQLSDLARDLGIVLVAGSFLEKAPPKRKLYNTCVAFDPFGQVLAQYRKIHLFDAGSVRESGFMLPGEEPVVTDTPVGRLGLTICYDVRFPELYRELAWQGAEIMTVVAAFPPRTGRAHWLTLLRARAIESQCYVVAANHCGRVPGCATYGHSAIVDPWGKVLAEADGRPGVITARVDLGYVEEVRTKLPSLALSRKKKWARIKE